MAIDIANPGADATALEAALQALVGLGFARDPDTTTGLTFGMAGGRITNGANSAFNIYAAGTVTLFDDTVNVLYLCPDLGSSLAAAVVVADSNAPEPHLPVGNWVLYRIETAGGEITQVVDWRTTVFAAFRGQGIISDFSYIKADDNEDGTFTVTLQSGKINTVGGLLSPSRLVDINDDAVNYIECSSSGTISANQSAFTAGRLPLLEIELSSGVIVGFTDHRGILFWPGGASGSFTTADDKTVTVVAGVITSIV